MELQTAKYFKESEAAEPNAQVANFANYVPRQAQEEDKDFFLVICGVNLALFVLIFSCLVSLYAIVKLAKLPDHIHVYNSLLAIVGRVLDEHCRTTRQQWNVYWISSGLVILCLTFIGCVPVTKSSLAACKASPLAHMVLMIGAQMRGKDANAFLTAAVYMILGTLGAAIGFTSLLTPNFDRVGKLETMIVMSMLAQVGSVGAIVGAIRLMREIPPQPAMLEEEQLLPPEVRQQNDEEVA